ncbi:MAG TPA: cupin domain-containing protein [Stellaceae bacterium]|nr:cupin domain-containing protein [Stellaceae bacterium]
MNAALILAEALSSDRRNLAWVPFRDGIDVAWLYRNGEHGPAAAYLRYAPGARVPLHLHAGYEHVLILEGSQSDKNGLHRAGTLAINPPGTSHEVLSEGGCLVLIIWERQVVLLESPLPP